MKQTHNTIALSAFVAVVIGFTGISVFADNIAQPELSDMELLAVDSTFYGHLEVVQRTADGDIIAYRQTDNVVTIEGKECAMEILFEGAAIGGSTSCPITSFPANFQTVELISAGTPIAGDTQATETTTEVTALGLTIGDGGCVIARTGAGVITCTVTFTAGAAVANQDVTGAWLVESATPTTMFAGNTFTSVTMNDSDTLLVTWTITLS